MRASNLRHWCRVVSVAVLLSVLFSPNVDARPKPGWWKKVIKVAWTDLKAGAESFGLASGVGVPPPWSVVVGCVGAAAGSIGAADTTAGLGALPSSPPRIPPVLTNPYEASGVLHNQVVWDYTRSGHSGLNPSEFLGFVTDSSEKYGYFKGSLTDSMLRVVLDRPIVDSDSTEIIIADALSSIPNSADKDVLSDVLLKLMMSYENYGLEGFDGYYSVYVGTALSSFTTLDKEVAGSLLSILRQSIWYNTARVRATGPIVHTRFGLGYNCYEKVGLCGFVGQDYVDSSKKKVKKKPPVKDTIKDNDWWSPTDPRWPPDDYIRSWTELHDSALTIHFSAKAPAQQTILDIEDDIRLDHEVAYSLGGENLMIFKGRYTIDYSTNEFGTVTVGCVSRGVPADCWFGRYKERQHIITDCEDGFGVCMLRFPPPDGWTADGAVPVVIVRMDSVLRMDILEDVAGRRDTFYVDTDYDLDTTLSHHLGSPALHILKGAYPVDYVRHKKGSVDLRFVPATTAISEQVPDMKDCNELGVATTTYYDTLGQQLHESMLPTAGYYFKVTRCVNGQTVVVKMLSGDQPTQ